MKHCEAITKKGTRCKNEAVDNSAWCSHHGPGATSPRWAAAAEVASERPEPRVASVESQLMHLGVAFGHDLREVIIRVDRILADTAGSERPTIADAMTDAIWKFVKHYDPVGTANDRRATDGSL